MKTTEKLAEIVHKAYCRYCTEIKNEEYWTKGDYSLLDDSVKEADRYTVRAIKAHLVGEIDKVRLEASTMDMNTRCEDMCDSIPYIEALSDIIELIEKS